MKLAHVLITISFLSLTHHIQSQDWRLYTASDAVNAYQLYHNSIWVSSGSGLSKVNVQTGEIQTWNVINSNLPDFRCNVMTIDSAGEIWMGLRGSSSTELIRFDGNDFESITTINGDEIRNILDLETTPDGKVWIYTNTLPLTLYQFNQNQFTAIPLPSSNYIYQRSNKSNVGTDDESNVWVVLTDSTTEKNFVGQYDGTQWTIHDVSGFGLEPNAEDAWARDHVGNIYLLQRDSDSPKLLKYDGQQWSTISLPGNANETRYVDQPIFVDHQNRIWLVLADNTILRYDGTSWTSISLDDIGLLGGEPNQFMLDQQDRWWINYHQYDGFYPLSYLYQFDGSNTHQINLANSSIPSNHVVGIVVDELNNKWINSTINLLKFDGLQWTAIHTVGDFYLWPIGTDKSGGIWLNPVESELALFDGVTFTKLQVTDVAGLPYPGFLNYDVDPIGRFISGDFSHNILVFDHGQVIHLDTIFYETDFGSFYPDYINYATADANGRIYAVGNNLHILNTDSSWSDIKLWDPFGATAYQMDIAPDAKIWATDALYAGFEIKYWIYDGASWSEFDSPMTLRSRVQWDQNSIPWFITDEGLCKNENGSWFCYNRDNSPILPDRITSFAIDQQNNFWITQENGGLLVFNEELIDSIDGQQRPVASGVVYRDLNQNGIKDNGDTPLAYQRELLLTDSTIVFSNFTGAYHLPVPAGAHEVQYIPRPNWHIDNSPASYNFIVDTDPVSGLDFNLQPDHEVTDLRLFMNEGFPRCESWSSYWLSFSNFGTQSASGEIFFIKDPRTTLGYIDPAPAFISGDTIAWNYSDLLPFGTGQFRFDLHMPGPSDTALVFSSYMNRYVNTSTEEVDSLTFEQTIRCSFDPNDKIARTVRSAGEGKSYLDDPLQYTIRFQNTGNDTALTIIVRDTLDTDLDLNTLEIISASHPYEAFLKQDRTLEFRFTNILLPDSTTNEMESHGFVSYSIKAKADLVSPAIIENTAHIYFDFNEAVQTNTAVNELVEFGTGIYNEAKLIHLVKAYPNPTSDEIFIEATGNAVGLINFSLFSMQGQVLQTGTLDQQESKRISLTKLPAGTYMLKARNGVAYQTLLLVKS